jgi:hypothetical protein
MTKELFMEAKGWLDRPIEFVAVGHLAIDHRRGSRVLGGAASYGCLTASRLGLAAAMVTAVGEDFDLFEPLEGIEIHFHQRGSSTSFENIYEGAVRRQRLLNRAYPLTKRDLVDLRPRLAEDAIIMYCPIAREVQAPLHRLTSRGLCGVVPQGFFRRWDEDGWILATHWNDVTEQLAEVDFVSTSAADPPQAERFRDKVADLIPVLAMTEGEQGAKVYVGGRRYHVPAFRREPVDPTGAGDVFAASFLVALRDGMEPLEAAQFACCSASFTVEREGVDGVPPDRQTVRERLSIYRTLYQPREISS